MDKPKFHMQDEQYREPYHHYVTFEPFSQVKSLDWGLEYYSYMSEALKELSLLGSTVQSVADVGCGDGKLLAEMSKNFPHISTIHGYDLSERSILFARAYTYGTKVECFIADLSTSKELYDVIFCLETLEHIPDEDMSGFVSSLKSHLKPGGKLIVSVPSVNIPLHRKHYRHYTAEILTDSLGSGLLVERAVYLDQNAIIKSFLSNRFFILRFRLFQKFLFSMYKRFSMISTPKKGRHVFGVFVKNV